MELFISFLVSAGIMALPVWFLKRHIDKNERKREAREKNTEKLMLMIMQNGRAAVVLSEATAKAVQRIPDAHCNGDMTEALRRAEAIQKEEQEFLLNQGIEHIFGTD